MDGQERNSCYTYFKITGDFDPDEISQIMNMAPDKQWKIGDLRRNKTKYDFALWEYGRCDCYDIYVENQMMKTLEGLFPKVKELNDIKQRFDVCYTLAIVPSIYAGGTNPCLAPNKDVIRFCYETDTNIDIDLYVFDSTDLLLNNKSSEY